jgi:hypothetical protein
MASNSQRLESTPVSFYGLALRLRRGASEIVSWSCDRGSLEGTLSVGADPSCDWTVRGPGIAPLEVYVQAPEGRLQVKSARPGLGAKLDGELLGSDWVSLDPGSRLEFGFACIALEFDAAPLTGVVAHEREVPLAFLGMELPAQELASAQPFASPPPPAPSVEPEEQPKPRVLKSGRVPKSRDEPMPEPMPRSGNSAIITQHLVFDSLLRSLESRSEQLRLWAREQTQLTRQRIALVRGQLLHWLEQAVQAATDLRTKGMKAFAPARGARPRKSSAPVQGRSVAPGRAPLSRGVKAAIYMVVGLLTLGAYFAWISLLDRM